MQFDANEKQRKKVSGHFRTNFRCNPTSNAVKRVIKSNKIKLLL